MEERRKSNCGRDRIIAELLTDYFAIISANLKTGKIKLISSDRKTKRMETDIQKFDGTYNDFFNYYLDKYIKKGKIDFTEDLSIENVRKKLLNYPIYSIFCKNSYKNNSRTIEIKFVDISTALDASRCLIIFRYLGDILLHNYNLRERDDLIRALVRYYSTIYHLDLDNDAFSILRTDNVINKQIYRDAYLKRSYSDTMKDFCKNFILDEDKEIFVRNTSIDYIKKRLETEESYSFRYRIKKNKDGEYFEVRVVRTIKEDERRFAVMTVRNVDKEVREELKYQLEIENANDELKKALEKEKVYQNELKNVLISAKAANQAKTDFLSRMSHEIHTPMNAIIGMTAIAAAHLDDVDKVKDCLEKISSSSQYLLEIINNILDMSKIESSKMEIKEEEFNLSDMVFELLDIINPQARTKKHNINVYVYNIEHENVIGDYNRLQQAFINIMSNAVKYTNDGGNITLSVTERKTKIANTGRYEFVFEDNGIGMSEDVMNIIFEPFERGEDLRTSKIKGTGLGMPITWNIIQAMGGTIDVESTVGKGSKFTVEVSLKLADIEEIDVTGLIGFSVLVIDYEPVSCKNTCIILNNIGMVSEGVYSIEDAIEKIADFRKKKKDFFAAIIDLKSLDDNIIEMVKNVRKEVGDKVPIIIASGNDWIDMEADLRDAGAYAFINKPLFKSSLTHVLKTFVSEKNEAKFNLVNEVEALTQYDFSSKRILLVEDNELNREIVAGIIETTGVMLEQAEDGLQAVNIIKNEPDYYYDMILMDIQMPNMNGYEATMAIRSIDNTYCKEIPIIAMTANTFEDDIHTALKAGMNEHLAKPIDFKQFYDVMKKWLG